MDQKGSNRSFPGRCRCAGEEHRGGAAHAAPESGLSAEPRCDHQRDRAPCGRSSIRAISGSRVSPMHNITLRMTELVTELSEILYDQTRCCLRYKRQLPGSDGDSDECDECDAEAARIVATFFDRLPAVRELLADDVQAAFEAIRRRKARMKRSFPIRDCWRSPCSGWRTSFIIRRSRCCPGS